MYLARVGLVLWVFRVGVGGENKDEVNGGGGGGGRRRRRRRRKVVPCIAAGCCCLFCAGFNVRLQPASQAADLKMAHLIL